MGRLLPARTLPVFQSTKFNYNTRSSWPTSYPATLGMETRHQTLRMPNGLIPFCSHQNQYQYNGRQARQGSVNEKLNIPNRVNS